MRMMMELKWFIRIAVMSVLLVLEGTTTYACLEHEKIALLQLKPFFNGFDYLYNWDEVKIPNCCQWKGIDYYTTTGRLIGLDLSDTMHGNKGWYLNASMFLPFVELKSLYLRSNAIAGCIQNEGFKKLSTALNNLEILDLSGNQLNDRIKGLKKLKVVYLHAAFTDGSISLLNLAEAFSTVKTLSLLGNHLNKAMSTQGLNPSTNVEEILLHGSTLNTNILQSIGVITSLKTLSLSGCGLIGSLPNQELFLYIAENNMVMGPSSYTPIPKFQLREINLSKCITSQELSLELPTFLHYQYDLRFVDLSGNNFSGTFPVWLLENNTKLGEFILNGNSFKGHLRLPSVPNSNLALFDISDNKLQGQISSNICSIYPHLGDLFLSKNAFEGNIPPCLSGMKDLFFLDLSDNQLSGRVPEELIMKSLMDGLRLSNNNLSGNVVPAILKANWLSNLYLDGNNFSGEMVNVDVSTFQFLTSLEEIDLSNNKLYGKLPRWMGNLSDLRRLALSNNSFEGSIQIEFCGLNELEFLDLSRNNLSGSIPSCVNPQNPIQHYQLIENPTEGETTINHAFANSYIEERIDFRTKSWFYSYGGNIVKYMTGIDLSCNKLTGQIPRELGNLSEIYSLNLSHNNLVGVIPSSFSKLKQIESLDLSYSKLCGEIPNQLVELNTLEDFSVAYNNLSGSIPESKAQFGTFIENSYEGNPFLCVPLLNKSCSKADAPSTESTPSDNDEGEDNWVDKYVFCVSFVVSYVVMLLTVFVVLYINPHWRRTWFSFVGKCITTCRYSTMGNFIVYHISKICA
ncbi:receptor-like protein 56 [Hibiscus syriacus]|nr:receptor-like protein 56 [Hibiscus syriacus]